MHVWNEYETSMALVGDVCLGLVVGWKFGELDSVFLFASGTLDMCVHGFSDCCIA